jgi:hypothetical protein
MVRWDVSVYHGGVELDYVTDIEAETREEAEQTAIDQVNFSIFATAKLLDIVKTEEDGENA